MERVARAGSAFDDVPALAPVIRRPSHDVGVVRIHQACDGVLIGGIHEDERVASGERRQVEHDRVEMVACREEDEPTFAAESDDRVVDAAGQLGVGQAAIRREEGRPLTVLPERRGGETGHEPGALIGA
jgi:hypothetical protein